MRQILDRVTKVVDVERVAWLQAWQAHDELVDEEATETRAEDILCDALAHELLE